MRIDKFLKVSRLIKRREVAKELCDAGLIWINDKAAKPSAEVNEGDIIILQLGKRKITAKVATIKQFASKEDASNMIEIISNEYKEAEK
jgi:ribosomal 50S subunit-recycling heat shock protein